MIMRFQQARGNHATIRRIFNGIVHNVVHDLRKLIRIDLNPKILACKMPLNGITLLFGILFFFDNHIKAIQNIAEQLVDVYIFQIQLGRSRIHARQA